MEKFWKEKLAVKKTNHSSIWDRASVRSNTCLNINFPVCSHTTQHNTTQQQTRFTLSKLNQLNCPHTSFSIEQIVISFFICIHVTDYNSFRTLTYEPQLSTPFNVWPHGHSVTVEDIFNIFCCDDVVKLLQVLLFVMTAIFCKI